MNVGTAPATLKWTLADGVSLTQEGPEGIVFQRASGDVPLRSLSPGLRAALYALAGGARTEHELAELVDTADGDAQIPTLFVYLSRLMQRGLLCQVVEVGGAPLATAIPCSPMCTFAGAKARLDTSYVLSRFAYAHRQHGRLEVESPLAHAKVALHGWEGAALLAALAEPVRASGLPARIPGLNRDTVLACLELLLNTGMVVAVPMDGTGEPVEAHLATWEFHDLLFHARSRLGRHANGFGGTFRFKGLLPPQPALKTPTSDRFVDLYRPDLEALRLKDAPFTEVLEGRRSVRETGTKPITAAQLGEFLYRVARVKGQAEAEESGGFAFRIYPGGGALYELELYPVIHACDGIAAGLWYYAPAEHRLYHVADETKPVEALLWQGAASGTRRELPQVLLVVTARFARVTWKYESMAYAAILKDVGVLYQTMYLVATAMGLAPCGLGGGDSDLFARAAGTDYYAETSIGEFMLGSQPDDAAR